MNDADRLRALMEEYVDNEGGLVAISEEWGGDLSGLAEFLLENGVTIAPAP